MRKFLRMVMMAGVALILAAALFLYGTYSASQHVPEFYERAIHLEPAAQAQAGDELERTALQLHNEVRQGGKWQAVLTDEQVNGWLAVDLPAKFPDMLAKEIRDPRVAISPQQAQLACRYESSLGTTVVSLALDIHLTNEPNVIAVRIRQARAGLIPLPLKQGLDQVSVAAREAGIPLRWTQKEGDPVALITVPVSLEEYGKQLLRLDSLDLREGEIRLSGRAERIDETPDTAIGK